MAVPDEIARSSLRLTVGRDNTPDQIDHVLDVLPKFVERLRSLSPINAATPSVELLAGRRD